jgi:hypothetical protein
MGGQLYVGSSRLEGRINARVLLGEVLHGENRTLLAVFPQLIQFVELDVGFPGNFNFVPV